MLIAVVYIYLTVKYKFLSIKEITYVKIMLDFTNTLKKWQYSSYLLLRLDYPPLF